MSAKCACGSEEYREAIYDGYGIFLIYACNACRQKKLKHFREDIFEKYECDEPIEEEE